MADFGSISNTTYASRTNTTVTAPSGITDGDLLLLIGITAASPEAPDPTPPSGFELIPGITWPREVTDGGFNLELRVWYKFASSESGNYAITHASCSSQGVMIRVTDADPSTPFNAVAVNSGTGSTLTWNGVTTDRDGCLIVLIEHDWADNSNNTTPPAGTTPTFTERLDTTLTYVCTGVLETAGATGNKTHTCNSQPGSPWGSITLAINPPPAAADWEVLDDFEGYGNQDPFTGDGNWTEGFTDVGSFKLVDGALYESTEIGGGGAISQRWSPEQFGPDVGVRLLFREGESLDANNGLTDDVGINIGVRGSGTYLVDAEGYFGEIVIDRGEGKLRADIARVFDGGDFESFVSEYIQPTAVDGIGFYAVGNKLTLQALVNGTWQTVAAYTDADNHIAGAGDIAIGRTGGSAVDSDWYGIEEVHVFEGDPLAGEDVRVVAGTVTLSLTASGSTAKTGGTAGSIALLLAAAGSAAKTTGVAGGIGLNITASDDASKTTSALGGIALSTDVAAQAAKIADTLGDLAVELGLQGAVTTTETRDTAGSIALTLGADGAVSKTASAAGGISLSMLLEAAAAKSTQAAGALALALAMTGDAAKTAQVAASLGLNLGAVGAVSAVGEDETHGAITLALAIAATAAKTADADGALAMMLAAAGTAAKTGRATGGIGLQLALSGAVEAVLPNETTGSIGLALAASGSAAKTANVVGSLQLVLALTIAVRALAPLLLRSWHHRAVSTRPGDHRAVTTRARDHTAVSTRPSNH